MDLTQYKKSERKSGNITYIRFKSTDKAYPIVQKLRINGYNVDAIANDLFCSAFQEKKK